MDDDVYDSLLSVLSGARRFQDWPKTDDPSLRQRVLFTENGKVVFTKLETYMIP